MKTNTFHWTQKKSSVRIFPAVVTLIAIVMFTLTSGCKDEVSAPGSTGQISMTTQYSKANSPTTIISKSVHQAAAVDSIRFTRARFIIRDIKFKTQSDSSNFRSAPFVWELNLASAIQDMSVANVPYGSYRKVEFDVHRIDTNDIKTFSAAEQALFQDFLAGERYSIIITGTVYAPGQTTAFTYRSKVNVKQKIDMVPELVVNQPSPAVNATMLVSSGGWFKSSAGVLLDPTDSKNESTIDDNLRASIKVFKDNNKDGSKDSN